ncbi:aminotransferase class I/II-fold pyridoxal phosphate-dependent enzyme, partial [Bacillus testis]
MKQEHTPLYDALKRFADEKPVSFHVPGHKNGQVFLDKGNDYFGQILKLDGTELEGLDDLHEPEGVIKEAEELLSALYDSQQSFFLVNGSTVGNLAMVLGTCKAGDTVLVQRNCHKSIMNALELARVKPVFLSPRYNDEWGTAEEVEFTTVQSALDTYVDAKALILTYPTYYGIGEDLTETIHLAHEHGVQVLVDEAHGAHFIAGEPFMKSSLAMGADYVVQSAHKTLPAMTMGSYLHIGQNCRFPHNIKEYLQILQSSSPSYPIMASLDLARSFLGTLTKEDLDYTKSCIEAFKKELSALEGIKLLQPARGSADLLKAVLQSDGTYSGFTLQEELRKEHIYTELADIRNVLLVLPILKAGQDYPFEQMV